MPQIEQDVGLLLKARGLTLAVAESCTGGLLGHRVTSVGGSSAYFLGGVIAYSNEAKMMQLDVSSAVLTEAGAVSEPVAGQMASGVRKACAADIGVGITGIAGPEGGTPEKPVGLVFVGLATVAGTTVQKFVFEGDRAAIKGSAGDAALTMLKHYLEGEGV